VEGENLDLLNNLSFYCKPKIIIISQLIFLFQKKKRAKGTEGRVFSIPFLL
jgi:hypothetical protein